MQHPLRSDIASQKRRDSDDSAHREESRRILSQFCRGIDKLTKSFDYKYERDELSEERYRQLLASQTEFTCRHHKLYWTTCQSCRRDAKRARYFRMTLYPRAVAWLIQLSSEK